jgi:hypothetical protein
LAGCRRQSTIFVVQCAIWHVVFVCYLLKWLCVFIADLKCLPLGAI